MNIDSTGSFAAGEVYFSSIMDNLITQAYYNQSLLVVLKKIILGEDQTTYKNNPLKRYRDVLSANIYLIDFPASLKNNIYKNNNFNLNGTTSNGNNNFELLKENSNKDQFISFNKEVENSNSNTNNNFNYNMFGSNKDGLGNLNNNNNNNNNDNDALERDTTMNKVTFKDIFMLLLKQKTVLIGVYRAIDPKVNYTLDKIGKFTNSNFYYVVTSPDPDTEINPKDKLFVFSQTFPEEDNMELKSNKEIKMFNLENEKNYDFSYFGVSKMNKKNEEKKENPKILDQIGEKKLLDLNEGLINIMTSLKDLNGSIAKVNVNLEKNISDAVKRKFKDINELSNHSNQTGFKEISENSEFEEVSKHNL